MLHTVRLDEIELSVTSGCNLHCRHCSVMPGNRADPRDLSLEEIVCILEGCHAVGATQIDLTGGEPALRHDLEEIIRQACARGLRVKLLSNGTFLTPDRLRSLHEAGLTALAVSIDGSTNEIHAATRNTTLHLFKRSLAALKNARDVGILVKVNTVVSRRNLKDLQRLVALVKDIGCFEHRLCSLVPTGWGVAQSDQTVDPIEWIKFIRSHLAPLDTDMPIYVSVDMLPIGISRQLQLGCLIAEQVKRVYIGAQGNVYPCPFFGFVKRSMSNVRENGFGHIVNSSVVWEKTLHDAPLVCPNVFRNKQGFVPVCPCRRIRARALG